MCYWRILSIHYTRRILFSLEASVETGRENLAKSVSPNPEVAERDQEARGKFSALLDLCVLFTVIILHDYFTAFRRELLQAVAQTRQTRIRVIRVG